MSDQIFVYLITFSLTLVIVVVAVYGFIRLGSPVYRLEAVNIIRLLELVIEGQATENDWMVFLGVPIRHNPRLAAVQSACQVITDREYLGQRGRLFTDKGIDELKEILQQLVEGDGDEQ